MTNIDGSSALAIDPARASLFAKMATVMKTVTRIPKGGYNSHHNYKYATTDDVADCIREAMGSSNLALFAEMDEPKQEVFEYTDTYGKKKTTVRTTIRFVFTFACGDTGAMMSKSWTGQVDDNSDKAINKCATAAEKYFLMKTFVVSAGDEPDADADKHQEEVGRKITPKWYEEKRNLDELSSRAFTSGFTKERNGKGIDEIKELIAPKTWADFETGRDCWIAIKDIIEARRNTQAVASDVTAPEADTAPQIAIATPSQTLEITTGQKPPEPDAPTLNDDHLPHVSQVPTAGGNIVTNKVEFDGKRVCVRIPNTNNVVPCGDKQTFSAWLDKGMVGLAAMNDVPAWKAGAGMPKEYPLSEAITVQWEMVNSAYVLVNLTVNSEPVPMGGQVL